MKLTIVIPTFNRSVGLVRTLRSIAAMEGLEQREWETVVVDNNCMDDTRERFAEFVAELSGTGKNFRIVVEKQQGLSHARNRGIVESRGAIVAFVDDDQEVNTLFGRAYIDFFEEHPEVSAAGGKITPLYEFQLPRWVSPLAERPIAGTLDLGPREREFPATKFPGGGNMSLRREVFDRIGMFDPGLGRTGSKLLAGEEKDLFARLREAGGIIWWVPRAEILHIIPRDRMTLRYLARVSRMVGVSEKVRTHDRGYSLRLASELFKWAATLALGLFYLLTLRPAKAWGLLILRANITRGLSLVLNGSHIASPPGTLLQASALTQLPL